MGAFTSKLNRLLSPVLLLGIMVLSNGCATTRRPSLTAAARSVVPARQSSSFETVALVDENVPASFSFQVGKGKLGSVKDAIRDSAEIGLSAPGVGIWIGGEVLLLESSDCGASDPRIPLVIAGAAGGATALGAAQKQAEYRSGKDLFLDWTYHGAVQSVAETGYQSLAKYYISQAVFQA